MNVVWAVMHGEAPTAPVVDPGPLGIQVPAQVMEWADGYGWGDDPDVWVAIAPLDTAQGRVDAAVAWCEGYVPEEDVRALEEALNAGA